MTPPHPDSADARNTFEDLSGVDNSAYDNPYDALIETCQNDPAQIQARYATHCSTRNGQQRVKLLSPEFSGLVLDHILQRLTDASIEPGYQDPRHSLVFWARPPPHIKSLVDRIQRDLLQLAPKLWVMPIENLHLTALEITHSRTAPEIASIITALGDSASTTMVDYLCTHRARLIKPILSYDTAAMALSFLPAAGEGLSANPDLPPGSRSMEDDKFTYHHLRRDLFNIAKETGVTVDSRYVVPSSHITIGRFIHQDDHDSAEKMAGWFKKIDEINQWLKAEYWPKEGSNKGEWILGQEKGLDYRKGTLWYGGGETIKLGKGF